MMYEFLCDDGHWTEWLCKVAERPDVVVCEECGSPSWRQLSLCSKTPGKWGDSASYFSPSLGCEVRNSAHRDKILKQRGLVAESDMPKGFIDDKIQKQVDETAQHEKNVSSFKDNLKKHNGNKGLAFADTFPAKDIL